MVSVLQTMKLQTFGSTLIRSAIVAIWSFQIKFFDMTTPSTGAAPDNIIMEQRKIHGLEFNCEYWYQSSLACIFPFYQLWPNEPLLSYDEVILMSLVLKCVKDIKKLLIVKYKKIKSSLTIWHLRSASNTYILQKNRCKTSTFSNTIFSADFTSKSKHNSEEKCSRSLSSINTTQ